MKRRRTPERDSDRSLWASDRLIAYRASGIKGQRQFYPVKETWFSLERYFVDLHNTRAG